jgi:hypothetical protein
MNHPHGGEMLCSRCDYRLARFGPLRDLYSERWQIQQWRVLARVVCAGCGLLLPNSDSTTTMLAKMSQLARFGLGGADKPLLGHVVQVREDT